MKKRLRGMYGLPLVRKGGKPMEMMISLSVKVSVADDRANINDVVRVGDAEAAGI